MIARLRASAAAAATLTLTLLAAPSGGHVGTGTVSAVVPLYLGGAADAVRGFAGAQQAMQVLLFSSIPMVFLSGFSWPAEALAPPLRVLAALATAWAFGALARRRASAR